MFSLLLVFSMFNFFSFFLLLSLSHPCASINCLDSTIEVTEFVILPKIESLLSILVSGKLSTTFH